MTLGLREREAEACFWGSGTGKKGVTCEFCGKEGRDFSILDRERA